jgi:hypothetical protein
MKNFKRNKSGQLGKIEFDKYHTPEYLSEKCVSLLNDFLGGPEGFYFLDPCAGDGSFSKLLKGCEAYDIKPEADGITRADFLSLDIPYKKYRVVVGNPPYGSRLNTAVKFFKKAVAISDYVAFLLPLSQFNKNGMFYEFDLVSSTRLGRHEFSGRLVDCVFNIYRRPSSGALNQRPLSRQYSKKLSDITISEVRVKNKIVTDYDIKICAWGSVGKEILEGEHYAKELYIKVNRNDIRQQVIALISEADWRDIYSMTGVCNLAQWHIIKYLKDNILDLH